MAHICLIIWVYGHVQGVGFRYSTQQQARALGVSGYARNLDDGSVEVQACGEQEQVMQLVTWIKAGGPRGARVDRVVTEPRPPEGAQGSFTVRH